MAQLAKKNLNTPDETRKFELGRLEVVQLNGDTIGRYVLEPGWKWSQHIKPQAGTDTCQHEHYQFVISGRLRVRMDDGNEFEVAGGEVMHLPPGHDAWVVGSEPFVAIDWTGTATYAKR